MRSITITFDAAEVEVDLRHVEQRRAREVALQLRGVRRFAHQVELIENRLLVLGDDFQRPQPARVGPVALGEIGERVEHFEIALDHFAHAGPQHLHDDFLAVRAVSPHAPARWTRRRAAVSSNSANTSVMGLP